MLGSNIFGGKHFWGSTILRGQQILEVKDIWVSTIFGCQISLAGLKKNWRSKFVGGPKIFGGQNFLGLNKFGVQHFWWVNNFRGQKFYCVKILGVNNFWRSKDWEVQYFRGQRVLDVKISGGSKNFKVHNIFRYKKL